MAYQAKTGGYIYRQRITAARARLKDQRAMLKSIAQGGVTNAELYQVLTAITLLNMTIDEELEGLYDFTVR